MYIFEINVVYLYEDKVSKLELLPLHSNTEKAMEVFIASNMQDSPSPKYNVDTSLLIKHSIISG